jgi:flagellin
MIADGGKLLSVQTLRTIRHNTSDLNKSLRNMSSGLRVQKAADDPAGLSVAKNMESDRRALTQAMRNTNDGISFIQRAEGSLNVISDILIRLKEISVAAANHTYTPQDLISMDTEYTGLITEIQCIINNSTFNRKNILNSGGEMSLQIGHENNQESRLKINLNTLNVTLGNLNITGRIQSLDNGGGQFDGTSIDFLDTAIQSISSRRAYVGALQNRLNNTLNNIVDQKNSLAGSSSQIVDTDYAHQGSELTKNQIINQAGVAAASQAKSIHQSIMTILT